MSSGFGALVPASCEECIINEEYILTIFAVSRSKKSPITESDRSVVNLSQSVFILLRKR